MSKTIKFLIVGFMLLVLALFPGCNSDAREFLPDITIPLESHSAEIVIKEWRWLMGSGAYIYYQQNGNQTLLGRTSGGDDGFCPFSFGEYSLAIDGSELIVRWAFRGGSSEDSWREDRFLLP